MLKRMFCQSPAFAAHPLPPFKRQSLPGRSRHRPRPAKAQIGAPIARTNRLLKKFLHYRRERGGADRSISPYCRICSPTVHCWMQNDWAYVLPYSFRNVLFKKQPSQYVSSSQAIWSNISLRRFRFFPIRPYPFPVNSVRLVMICPSSAWRASESASLFCLREIGSYAGSM